MNRFALAVYRLDGRIVPVMEIGGRAYDLARAAPQLFPLGTERGLLPLFTDWSRSEAELARLAEGNSSGALPEIDMRSRANEVLAPLLYPSKVICVGANYSSHASELAATGMARETAPTAYFLRPPSTAVVGPGRTVRLPRGETKLDWEIELAAVIGKAASGILPDRALDHVAAYSIAIDITARSRMFDPENLTGIDVFRGKAFDTSCPFGPRLLPARFIKNPQALDLRLRVNSKVMQLSSTAAMRKPIHELVADISSIVSLEPGDIILTGTPGGTAYPAGPFLVPGDVLQAEIEEIGELSVEILGV